MNIQHRIVEVEDDKRTEAQAVAFHDAILEVCAQHSAGNGGFVLIVRESDDQEKTLLTNLPIAQALGDLVQMAQNVAGTIQEKLGGGAND